MENIAKVTEVSKELIDLLSPSIYKPSSTKVQKIIENYLSSDTKKLYVYKKHKVLLGIVGIEFSSNKIILKHMAVKDTFRRQGIGSKLILFLSSEYKTTIELETDDDAIGFYTKIGFESENLGEIYPGFTRYRCTLKY